MKLIRRLITGIIVMVSILALVVIAGYIYVRATYGIDLFNTVKELKILGDEVNEEELCKNAFSDDDMVDVQTEVNKSVENFITWTKENGYVVNFGDLPSEMKYIIKLTDKQVGALANTIVKQEMDGKIDVGGKEIGLELKQVDFTEVEDGNAVVNAVIKLDITSIKAGMQGFPFDYLKKYVPDYFYVSSTVQAIKGEEAFSYTVSHVSLTVNNLSSNETEDLFRTLDIVLGIGTAKDLNEQIGNTLIDALVGGEEQNGLAYSLKEIGAKDCTFIIDGKIEYFAVERAE